MATEYEEFLEFAIDILKKPDCDEVHIRNAISRAYYSSYHACKSRIEVNRYPKAGMHECLIRSMREHSDDDVQALAELLKNCKAKRVKADYKLNFTIMDNEAHQAVAEAQSIHRSILALDNAAA
jgi:uncharacterized protein (UPF0332 family)